MKLVNQIGLFLLAPGMAFAQPMTTSCNDAAKIYASLSNSYINFARANAETLTQNSILQDSAVWFEAPMAQIQAEAVRNYSRNKTLSKRKCTTNYALYFSIAEKIKQFSNQSVIQNRNPATLAASLVSSTSSLPSEYRAIKRKAGIVSRALSEMQIEKCLEKMKSEGEFRALSDLEASALYARYLNNYIQNGGKISAHVDQNFQNSDPLQSALKKEISASAQKGDTEYAANLQYALETFGHQKVFVARKSFHACPVTGTSKIKILIPSEVNVLSGSRGQNEYIFQDASLWSATQAIQYSDTKVEQYPALVMKNKINALKLFFKNWSNETTVSPAIAIK